MNTQRLIIIGAGPKAMAIAAKNHTLRELGFRTPEIVIIERSEVAAHWTGGGGFTNGRLPLGTSPEKDVGFPYETQLGFGEWDQKINERMHRYSWQAYLVACGTYSDWVDRGRPAPLHREWASYLRWVYDMVRPSLRCLRGVVHSVEREGNQWLVTFNRPDGEVWQERGDGLVLTGPGKATPNHSLPNHDRLLTVESFWNRYRVYQDCGPHRIAIIGAGENAASIALSLLSLGNEQLQIEVISPSGMLYSRGESFQENRIYSNAETSHWHALSLADRREFIYRTDRGVFSSYAQAQLNQARGFTVQLGRMRQVEVAADDNLTVSIAYETNERQLTYQSVVVATGGNQSGFLQETLSAGARTALLSESGIAELTDAHLESAIETDLSVGSQFPKLHLPMLSGIRQGPGYANLSCLGRLSDRILKPYIQVGG